MSTPTTTVRFQIAVPTTNGDGCTTDTMYRLTLNLQVEGPADGEIRVSLLPDFEPSPPMIEPNPQAPGAAPLPTDPPN